MTPKQVVKYFGGPTKSVSVAARKLECTAEAVYKWIRSRRIPILRQHVIQSMTEGKLRADEATKP